MDVNYRITTENRKISYVYGEQDKRGKILDAVANLTSTTL